MLARGAAGPRLIASPTSLTMLAIFRTVAILCRRLGAVAWTKISGVSSGSILVVRVSGIGMGWFPRGSRPEPAPSQETLRCSRPHRVLSASTTGRRAPRVAARERVVGLWRYRIFSSSQRVVCGGTERGDPEPHIGGFVECQPRRRGAQLQGCRPCTSLTLRTISSWVGGSAFLALDYCFDVELARESRVTRG